LTDKYLKRDVFVMLFKRSNNDGEKHSIVKKGTDKEDIFNVLRIFQFSPISEKFILIIARISQIMEWIVGFLIIKTLSESGKISKCLKLVRTQS
jgi:hypothetical protein